MERLTVSMRGITKRFPRVLANNRIDLEITPGQVHCLLGENGAGKTTLMKVLYGMYQPDEGQIFLDGQPIVISSPREALGRGIGMVHQQFMLNPRLTVAQNVVLGLATPAFWLDLVEIGRETTELSSVYGLPVDPKVRVGSLSVGEQQRVEILKMLYRRVRILILDEPTTVLTPTEIDQFFAVLRQLAQEGCGIVLITHKLNEAMAIADQITVLRNGAVVGTFSRQEANVAELARMMVGEEPIVQRFGDDSHPGEIVLQIEDLVVRGPKRNQPLVDRVTLEVRRGQILGLAGVAGNGQTALVNTLLGRLRVDSGSLTIYGVEVTHASPSQIASLVGLIPEDRRDGLAPDLSVQDNLTARWLQGERGFLDQGRARDFAQELLEQYQIRPPDLRLKAGTLSGGNQQRVILARELSAKRELLIAVHPTRGLDLKATAFVQRCLDQRRKEGGAILLVSEDLDEIRVLSNRIAVMCRGQIIGVDDTDHLTNGDPRLSRWMAGICE